MERKNKYIILSSSILVVLGGTYFVNTGYSEIDNICSYTDKIEQCFYENGSGFPESIEEFVCLQSNNKEEIVYQIILDEKFKEVDEKIEVYLQGLETDKGKYFGVLKTESYLEGVKVIYEKLSKNGEYWKLYQKRCMLGNDDSILEESISCLGGETNIDYSKNMFEDEICISLAEAKLDIYKEVAVDILKYNKHEVRKDDRKTYEKLQRSKYDEVSDLFRINLGYIERIWKKWISKTKNPY